MAEKKSQITFRASEAFRAELEAQSIKRDMTVQDLITAACKMYFTVPLGEWDYAIAQFIRHKDVAEEARGERKNWVDIFLRYIDCMPRKKILLLVETMQLDIRHYGSSRRKH